MVKSPRIGKGSGIKSWMEGQDIWMLASALGGGVGQGRRAAVPHPSLRAPSPKETDPWASRPLRVLLPHEKGGPAALKCREDKSTPGDWQIPEMMAWNTGARQAQR